MVECVVCASRETTTLFQANDRATGIDGRYAVVRCSSCGLAYTNPRPIEADLPKCYPGEMYFGPADQSSMTAPPSSHRGPAAWFHWLANGYPLPTRGAIGEIPLVSKILRAAARPVAGLHVPVFRPGGRLLEIGFGGGGMLAKMRDAGWNVIGADFSPYACRKATREYRLRAAAMSAQALALKGNSIDAVYLHHVLEHMPDPIACLREIRRVLRPGGQVVLVVPNFGCAQARAYRSDWRALEVPRHLYHFTRRSLSAVMARGGFTRPRISPALVHAANIFHANRPPFAEFDRDGAATWWWSSVALRVALACALVPVGFGDSLVGSAFKED